MFVLLMVKNLFQTFRIMLSKQIASVAGFGSFTLKAIQSTKYNAFLVLHSLFPSNQRSNTGNAML